MVMTTQTISVRVAHMEKEAFRSLFLTVIMVFWLLALAIKTMLISP